MQHPALGLFELRQQRLASLLRSPLARRGPGGVENSKENRDPLKRIVVLGVCELVSLIETITKKFTEFETDS